MKKSVDIRARANNGVLDPAPEAWPVRFKSRRAAGVLVFAICAFVWLFCIGQAMANESLSTTIVGLQLKGKKPYERKVIKDLDILQIDDTTRYAPLFRLLSELAVETTESGDTLKFVSGRGVHFGVVIADRMLFEPKQEPRVLDCRYGVSDLTGNMELFITEADVKALLDIRLTWSEIDFAYLGETQSTYPVWSQLSSSGDKKKKVSSAVAVVGADLPVAEPTGPSRLGDPSVHMFQPGIRLTQTSNDYLHSQKSLNVWGRLGGGRYVVRLSQTEDDWTTEPSLNRFSLTHRLGDMETTLGDVSFGLSDLVYPSSSVVGFHATGYWGMSEQQRLADRTDFGRLDVFSSSDVIRGQALLESRVELYLNDRYVAEQLVSEVRGARDGYGVYEFRDVAMPRDRPTEIRVEITEPDGTVRQHYKEPVGTTALLGRGQLLLGGAAGQRRFTTGEFWNTQGQLYGGRMLYGLTPFLTLGLTGAAQNEHAFTFNLDDSNRVRGIGDLPPRESQHGGAQLRLRLLKRNVLEFEAAGSRGRWDPNLEPRDDEDTLSPPPDPYDKVEWGDQALALRSSFDTYWGKFLKLRPFIFQYDRDYYNGSNPDVRDRGGYALTARFQVSRGLRLTTTHGFIHDNVDGKTDSTNLQQWSHADFPLPRLVPRLSVRVNVDRLQSMTDFDSGSAQSDTTKDARYLTRIDINSTMLRVAELTASISAGENLLERHEVDLMRSFSVPNAVSSNRPGWNAQLTRKLMKNGLFTLSHSKSEYRERSQVSHTLRATDHSHLQWRYDLGYDWESQTPFAQAQPEWYFDRTGTSRITFMARYINEDWIFSAGMRLEPIFSFVGGFPLMLPYSKVNPTNGGIKGRVYLDQNGNGIRDRREPGVAGIEVVADGGRRATSGKRGEFLIAGSSQKRKIRVALDPRKLPVDYTALTGQQWVDTEPGMLSPAGLAVVKLGSISGLLMGPNLADSINHSEKEITSARVVARDASGNIVQESISYSDGSFYLGELKPGRYFVDVDRATVLPGYRLAQPIGPVVVEDRGEEGLDISGLELHMIYEPPPKAEESK